MRKKIIALHLLGGLALYTVTYIVFFSRIPGSTFLRPVLPKEETADVFMFIEVLVLLAGGLLVLLGTINSLVQQAKHLQWAWFVCTILFGPPFTLLWLLFAKPKKPEHSSLSLESKSSSADIIQSTTERRSPAFNEGTTMMRRKTLAILTLISLGLFLVGIGIIAVEAAATAVYCSSPACPLPSLPPGPPPTWVIVISVIGQMSIVVAGVLQIIAWIGAMTRQAKLRQWIWFMCTLLFSPICLWLYLLTPEAPKPISIQPEQSIYQPYTQGYGTPQPVHTHSEVYQEGEQYQDLEQQQQQWPYEEPMVMYPQE